MINPISFNGTYKVTTKPSKKNSLNKKNIESEKNFRAFKQYCNSLLKHNKGVSVNFNYSVRDKYPYYYDGEVILHTPISLDSEVESYLSYHKIKYSKLKNPKI